MHSWSTCSWVWSLYRLVFFLNFLCKWHRWFLNEILCQVQQITNFLMIYELVGNFKWIIGFKEMIVINFSKYFINFSESSCYWTPRAYRSVNNSSVTWPTDVIFKSIDVLIIEHNFSNTGSENFNDINVSINTILHWRIFNNWWAKMDLIS